MIRKILLLTCFLTSSSHAKDFSLHGGLGISKLSGSSSAFLTAGLEFEYKLIDFFGAGAFTNYIFADPHLAIIGFPQLYVHPLAGDWYLSASPVVRFGSGRNTEWGYRLGTRAPLELGPSLLTPVVSADFFSGNVSWNFGLGISI